MTDYLVKPPGLAWWKVRFKYHRRPLRFLLSDTSGSSEGLKVRLPSADRPVFSLCLPPGSDQGLEENQTPAMCSAARETPQTLKRFWYPATTSSELGSLIFLFLKVSQDTFISCKNTLLPIVCLVLGPASTEECENECVLLLHFYYEF